MDTLERIVRIEELLTETNQQFRTLTANYPARRSIPRIALAFDIAYDEEGFHFNKTATFRNARKNLYLIAASIGKGDRVVFTFSGDILTMFYDDLLQVLHKLDDENVCRLVYSVRTDEDGFVLLEGRNELLPVHPW